MYYFIFRVKAFNLFNYRNIINLEVDFLKVPLTGAGCART
jgi:hypothetical protein